MKFASNICNTSREIEEKGQDKVAPLPLGCGFSLLEDNSNVISKHNDFQIIFTSCVLEKQVEDIIDCIN